MDSTQSMPKFSLLVLVYNKEASDCLTIQALLNYPAFLENSHLCLWNNGPNEIIIPNEISSAAHTFSLIQTVNNESLSKIYNSFFENNDSEYYVLLDDDSEISADYVADALNLTDEKFVTPLIKSSGKIVSPSNKIENSKETGRSLRAIASGLILNQEVVAELKKRYDSIVDERFYFYGVDTSLIYRINKLGIKNDIISGFEHKVSEHVKESSTREDFKERELSYSFGLKLRHYPSVELYKTLVKVFFNCILRRKNKLKMKHFAKTFILKTHPKNLKNHNEKSISNSTNLQKK